MSTSDEQREKAFEKYWAPIFKDYFEEAFENEIELFREVWQPDVENYRKEAYEDFLQEEEKGRRMSNPDLPDRVSRSTHKGQMPVIVWVSEELYADIQRLKIDLTANTLEWLYVYISCCDDDPEDRITF